MKSKFGLLVLGILIVVGGGLAYWIWTQTPGYSLRQIQRAVETHDLAKFEKHVDMERVSSRFVSDVTEHSIRASNGESGSSNLGAAFAQGLTRLAKPLLVDVVKQQMDQLVEEGSLVSSPQDTLASDDEQVSLETYSDVIESEGNSFEGISYTRRDGKLARLGLDFRSDNLNADLLVEVKMRDMGRYWQVIELSNLPDLLQEVDSLHAARLAELNEPIREQIDEALQVESVRKRTRADYWGINKYIVYDISLTNPSTRTVSGFGATLKIHDSTGDLLREVSVEDDQPIGPSEQRSDSWSTEVNMFDEINNLLYETPSSDLQLELDIQRVTFDDGLELKLFESLADTTRSDVYISES